MKNMVIIKASKRYVGIIMGENEKELNYNCISYISNIRNKEKDIKSCKIMQLNDDREFTNLLSSNW